MTIEENLLSVREQIAKACSLSGRKETSVKLVAVSKYHPLADISAAINCGQMEFGENYFQEWQKKADEFSQIKPDLNLQWHLIGHLQSRKAHLAAGKFTLIHTLDSEKLANALQKTLFEKNIHQDVLIEVNVAKESQKTGIYAENLRSFVEKILEFCPNLRLQGLMCMAPYSSQGEDSRKYFSALRKLRDELEVGYGIKLPQLSMGMSGDFEAAIAEGATITRVGTAIFGPRPGKFFV